MSLTSLADRFRSARPLQIPAALVCWAIMSRIAYGQFDPASVFAPPKPESPSGTDRTILLTECVDPRHYTFGDEDPPYQVDRKQLFGEPFVAAEQTVLRNSGLAPIYLPVVIWTDETALRYLDLDPAIFAADRKPAASPEELEHLRQGKAKLLEAAAALARRDADRALILFHEAAEHIGLLPSPELLAARLARRIDDAKFRHGAKRLLDEAALNDPQSPEPPLDAAVVALDEGRLADAVAQVDRCLNRIDNGLRIAWGPSSEKFLSAKAHAIEVEVYRRTQRWRLVERAAGAWLAAEPEAPKALSALGEAAYGIDSTSYERHQIAFGLFETAYRSALARRKHSSDAPELPPPELQMAEVAARHGHQETAAKWREKHRAGQSSPDGAGAPSAPRKPTAVEE